MLGGLPAGFMWRFPVALVLLMTGLNTDGVIQELRLASCRMLAASCSFIFELVGVPVMLSGDGLFYQDRGFQVVPGCDAADLIFVFVAIAVSLPVWKGQFQRAGAAALAAIFTLIAVNSLRVFAAAAVALFKPEIYGVVHTYALQGAVIVATLLVVHAWVQAVARRDELANGV
jgi:exosortase/archaeosortase family protein